MKMTETLTVITPLGTILKVLVKGVEDLEIRGRVETFQTIVLLGLARILRRVQENWTSTCFHSNSSGRRSSNAGAKNSQKSRIILIIGTIPQNLTEVLEIRGHTEHSKHSMFKIGQNTEKSPGDLRKLAVTQPPMKDHQPMLVWIIIIVIIIIIIIIETIQTTTLLRTARILRRVLETWGDLLSLQLQWKTIS